MKSECTVTKSSIYTIGWLENDNHYIVFGLFWFVLCFLSHLVSFLCIRSYLISFISRFDWLYFCLTFEWRCACYVCFTYLAFSLVPCYDLAILNFILDRCEIHFSLVFGFDCFFVLFLECLCIELNLLVCCCCYSDLELTFFFCLRVWLECVFIKWFVLCQCPEGFFLLYSFFVCFSIGYSPSTVAKFQTESSIHLMFLLGWYLRFMVYPESFCVCGLGKIEASQRFGAIHFFFFYPDVVCASDGNKYDRVAVHLVSS